MALSLRGNAMRGLVLAALALAFLAWIVQLAGVSALQKDCSGGNGPRIIGGVGELGNVPCGKLFAYQWWKTFWELFVLLLVAIALALGQVHTFRVALAAFLAIATVLLMDSTNTFFFAWLQNNSSHTFHQRLITYFAGTLITAAANLLLIGALGTHDEADVASTGANYPGYTHKAGPAGTAGTGRTGDGAGTTGSFPQHHAGAAPGTGTTTTAAPGATHTAQV